MCMDIKEICNNLKEKYDYDEELLVFIEHLIPTMVDYFGEEYREKIANIKNNYEIDEEY